MLKQEKRNLAESLSSLLNEKSCVVVLKHEKLTFNSIDKLRREASEGTVIKKIKNRIAKNALKNSHCEILINSLKNENIFIFSNDIFDACKIAKMFEKDVEKMSIIAGTSKDEAYNAETINIIGALGSKQSLQSKLLSVINEVPSKLLRVMKAKCEKE